MVESGDNWNIAQLWNYPMIVKEHWKALAMKLVQISVDSSCLTV